MISKLGTCDECLHGSFDVDTCEKDDCCVYATTIYAFRQHHTRLLSCNLPDRSCILPLSNQDS
jgi:hypothetical protein